ncbi:hypothetical protein HYPSUDRAFT_210063 [Hypholoma sublateritium FD-334 SS-4]|uniref:Uncharacterized protein n=1 Tax=Hypholoma sublateritium (strain FD-334 SS-4) TaxID=945553 RepID=A0A0D2KE97_HYPSF|nr:hypothetical protein HYPSUDRAFT_210063 [Hypholoma sublateritium FD-334 SS-4]
MDPALRTPHRRSKALTMAQKEKDIEAADAYIVLDTEDELWRQMWILQTIEDVKLAPSLI